MSARRPPTRGWFHEKWRTEETPKSFCPTPTSPATKNNDLRVLCAKIIDSSIKVVASMASSFEIRELSWEEFKRIRGGEIINLSVFEFIDLNINSLGAFEGAKLSLEELCVNMLERFEDQELHEILRGLGDEQGCNNLVQQIAIEELCKRLSNQPHEQDFRWRLA